MLFGGVESLVFNYLNYHIGALDKIASSKVKEFRGSKIYSLWMDCIKKQLQMFTIIKVIF